MQLQHWLVMILQADSVLRWCLMYMFARLTLVGCQIWWRTSGKK